ncbi:S8 family serine peptidase [Dyadobacter fanqingshengii]|uniref:S8 family serine peptidase n=1 Tax=Dyadobacter fanqingshengii TaxID=2906443 RepID=A0A9X1P9E5_9BACT|nr:S8 family serine peptidase [Dyadobacter fanqingshengii]MCF0040781.1 S8 family serine peptidase [Dyadobacter fanqingshengii]USJ37484.1 S8 family serine peptidase [Dyadobacter fanqingshengii]
MIKIYAILLLLMVGFQAYAQEKTLPRLYLRNGPIVPENNIINAGSGKGNARKTDGVEQVFIIIQFSGIPSESDKEKLQNADITLLEYIPENAYTAVANKGINMATLQNTSAKSVVFLNPEQKIQPILLTNNIPDYATHGTDKVDVNISFPHSFSFEEISQNLAQSGIEVISDALKAYQIMEVRIAKDSLRAFTRFPWIQYIELIPQPEEPLMDKSTTTTRANVLHSAKLAGYSLTGEGVVIGIGDYGNPKLHADVRKRIISDVPMASNAHGQHMTGIAAGAGIINEKYKGYAPKALIVSREHSEIWKNAATLVRDFNMVATNNSYAPGEGGGGCPGFGSYTFYSYVLDRQAFELPFLQHVFAAGNSGLAAPCNGFPGGYGNVLGEYMSAKNVITVGQTYTDGVIFPTSSKGPVQDGRIKPELTAPGTGIVSTVPVNNYQAGTGTSMAAPAVVGGLALLYQRYRQLNNQNNPKNALMKALLCNGAADRGMGGPDYSYGFGNMNLLRSVTMLDKKHYFTGTLAHKASEVHQITIPANTAELKVMLYWNDPAPSILAGGKTLVNNLNLTLTPNGSSAKLPQFPMSSSPETAAITGVDSVNNVEQIVIEKPAAGNYSLKILAEKIPDGTQEYFLVYDVIENATTITYPIGAERLAKGDVVNISWDSYGNKTSTFNILYSFNNGESWTSINPNVAANLRQLAWTVPDATTRLAKIRIIQNETGITRESDVFTILGLPALTLSPAQCEGYAAIQWTAVSGATEYEVMMLDGEQMKTVAKTTELKYLFSGLSTDSTYIFSVRARKDTINGRRSVAITRRPNTGTCIGTISDKDLKVESVVSPAESGRMFTSTSLSATQKITVRIKNVDDQPTTGAVQVGYAIGSGDPPVHWETVASAVPGGGFVDFTFNKEANMLTPGSYPMKVLVKYSGDPVEGNNLLTKTFKQLPNPVLTLPYFQNFESVAGQQIIADKEEVVGADAYVFTKSTADGRLRTFVEPVAAYSGSKALTVDAQNATTTSNETNITGTYNLSQYKIDSDELRLSFRYKVNGPDYNKSYNVYVRGSENDSWISTYALFVREDEVTDKGFSFVSIELSNILKQSSQQYSATFQVKWALVADYNKQEDGLVLDDVSLLKAMSDLAITDIIAPNISPCDFGGQNQFSLVVKNNGDSDCFNVPVRYAGNQSANYAGWIPVIRKGESLNISYAYPYDVFVSGTHNFSVWVEKANDINNHNDTVHVVLQTSGQIGQFPYHQDFENGEGGWYSEGTNNSWQFGTPNAPKTKGAASGSKAWKTSLTGNYNSNELSYLYSPCFNIPFMQNPRLSFSTSIDFASCPGGVCDMAYVEYNLGAGWQRLGMSGAETNWYNAETGGFGVWSAQDYTRWHVSTIPLPIHSYQTIRIRFVVKTDGQNNREGLAIDDIHVYDLAQEIFSQTPGSVSMHQSGLVADNWNFFLQDNRLLAAINPHAQDMGVVSLQTFLNDGTIKNNNGQHYMNRNFIISTTNKNLSNFVSVRLYFTDKEVEKLIGAPVVKNVEKPQSAYELGITKYSGVNEDGNLMNNGDATWAFYPKTAISKVPFGQGYYLEFKTKTFSEFWFGKEFVGTGTPLPVELIGFSAKKVNAADGSDHARLDWKTASEKSFSHFEIEMAEGNQKMLKNEFVKVATLKGAGESSVQNTYTFTDRSPKESVIYYYRLALTDTDKSVRYSAVRAVNFVQQQSWRVFPNPSDGKFNIEFKANKGENMKFNVHDLNGKLVRSAVVNATGSVQKQEILLSPKDISSGLYLIQVISKDAEQTFKVIMK